LEGKPATKPGFDMMKGLKKYVLHLTLALFLTIPQQAPATTPAPVSSGHVACFVYHRFDDNRYPSTNIPASVFREQLTYLAQNNFTVWNLEELVVFMKEEGSIPARSVVITIDDAYLSFYENGLPILEEFGYPATLFVNTLNTGDADYMNWGQIIDAQKRGVTIGNHSHSHGHFLNIREGEERKKVFTDDLLQAHSLFGEHLGNIPKLYSYPYGEFDQLMAEILMEAGYWAAAAQNSGILYDRELLFEMPRFPMGGPFATVIGFIEKAQMNPLPVISKYPQSMVMLQNPPALEVIIDKACIDADRIQCFVDGTRNCITEVREGPENIRLKVTARSPLNGRRSLYTITAPLLNGKGWCWFSHIWVNTAVKED
jgi:peptidoglycan/xylan/chitin deacetylase (PgdA/CDA1 family)